MQINIDKLFSASKLNLVSFNDLPAAAIPIKHVKSISHELKLKIVDRYNKYGFAIVEFTSDKPDAEALLGLASSLNLGEPYIPPLYSKGDYIAPKVSKLTTSIDENTSHPTFQREVGIKLHCDGTLQKIGFIKSSILVCESPGAKGGDTTLFNATGAFAKLLDLDVDAALALATPGVLVRQANMNGCSDKNEGPAFTVQDDMLVCAYSVTETDKFFAVKGINKKVLQRGIKYMREASQPDSPFYTQLRLERGQAILFANTRIAHGRKPYRNSGNQVRILYRGIFCEYPRVENRDAFKMVS